MHRLASFPAQELDTYIDHLKELSDELKSHKRTRVAKRLAEAAISIDNSKVWLRHARNILQNTE